jgi:iron complex transport system permease protein
MVFGPDHRLLLPASFILGGTFLVLADTLARTIIAPAEIPVGAVTAVIGAPVFIYLLRRR